MRELILVAVLAAFLALQPGMFIEVGCSEVGGLYECEAWEYAPIPDTLAAKVEATWHNQPGK